MGTNNKFEQIEESVNLNIRQLKLPRQAAGKKKRTKKILLKILREQSTS
jgi:hypothetical protein